MHPLIGYRTQYTMENKAVIDRRLHPGVATLRVTLSTRREVVESVRCLQRVFLRAKPKAAYV